MRDHRDKQNHSRREIEEHQAFESALGAGKKFQSRHLPQLDGFRGLAVMLVLAGHVLEFSGLSSMWTRAGAVPAALGVFLFFVLSGFLITSLLYVEKRDSGKTHLLNFYIRRILRLGPALLRFFR